MGFWSKLMVYGKKAFITAATAVTGYEIGNHLESEDKIQYRETTIIEKEKSGSIEIYIVILIILIIVAIIFVITKTAITCVMKNKNSNNASASINLEAAQPSAK